ncbi:hypothetical protein AQUCO_00300280v1, partial [Aquilegia coerulea]
MDQLPYHISFLIAERLETVSDKCCFRSLSKSWRAALPTFFVQPPFLMLSESQLDSFENNKNKSEKDEKVEVNPHPRVPLRGFVGHQMRFVRSTGNWLIAIDLSDEIHILNPFSRVQFHLPSVSKFENVVNQNIDRNCIVHKVILSSTPLITKDCIAIAIHHHKRLVAIARLGDPSWITIQTPYYIDDVIFFKNQFYVVTVEGVAMVCDIVDRMASVLTEVLPVSGIGLQYELKYLVEMSGELLLVVKFLCHYNDHYEDYDEFFHDIKDPAYKTDKFEVHRLDILDKKWKRLLNLGNYYLFFGFNTSIAISAENYPGLRNNCIYYYTDDYAYGYMSDKSPGGIDMGVFDLEDKTIRPHYQGVSNCYYSPPLWVIPIAHSESSLSASPVPAANY